MNYLYKNTSNTNGFSFGIYNPKKNTTISFLGGLKTVVLVMMLLVFSNSKAATITSTATGGTWATASTWVGGVVPSAADNVIIATTGTSSVDVQANITQTGSVTVNSGAIFASTTGATVIIGSLTVVSGGTVNMNRNFTVTGSTTISGTINFASNSGTARTMTFTGDVTLNSGSIWTEPATGNGANNNYSFGGNFINNATTFSALGNGSHTFSGTAKTVSGVSTTIPVIVISGSITNSITLTVGTSLTVSSGGTLQMGSGGSPSLVNGSGTFVLSAGATIGITSVDGISVTGTTGNIQNSGTRTYTAGSNYIYNGNANQITGNGLNQNSPLNVQINNTGYTVSLSAATTMTGNLSVLSGAVVNLGTFSSTAVSLTLGGVVQNTGTSYGGTGTSGSTINSTYFAATSGKITVGTVCTTGVWVGTTSADWNTASNWCNGTLPTAATAVTINSGGNQPTISGSAFCNGITINTGATLTVSATGTLAVSGAITKNGTLTLATGSTINYAAAGNQTVLDVAYSNLTTSGTGTKTQALGGNRSFSGNLTIGSGTNYTTSGNKTLTISGTTNVSGTLTLGGTSAKTFTGNVTINSGGVWNETGISSYSFAGNFTNNATTFTANTGNHTFTGAAKTFSGSTITAIPTLTITGTYTNSGTLTVATALTATAVGSSLTQSTTVVLNIGGTSAITTFNASAIGNTVNYTSANQTILATTYHNLTLGGAVKTFPTGTTTINGVLSIENGTSTNVFTGSIAYGPSATLQYNAAASARTVASEWPATFSATGGVVIKGTGLITLNAAKVLGTNTKVSLNITSGAKLVTANLGLTFNGDFTNAGTFTAGSSPITITGTTTTQNIAGFTTTGAVSMTKNSGVATITSAISAAALTINGTSGTLNLGSSLTHTFSGDVTLTSGTLNGGVLNTINVTSSTTSAWNGTGSVFDPGTSTVVFGGVAQTIAATSPTFYNVSFSGTTATKTITNSLTVANNINIISSAKLLLTTGTISTTKVLQFGGVSQVGGSWGFTGSSATNTNTTYFITGGTGILNSSTAQRFVITGAATQVAGASQNLTITAQNADGSTLTSYTGDKSLTFSGATSSPNGTAPTIKDKTGTLVPFGTPTTITFASGVATVSGGNNGVMTLYKAEVATIAAVDGAITSTGSDRLFVTVSNSASTSLVFTTQPNGGNTNEFWTNQPVVTWQDSYSNLVLGTAKNVTLAIGTNPSSGVLNGVITAALNVLTGQAIFDGLSIDKSGTGYTLSATATSVTTGTSAAFNISNPAPSLNTITPNTVCSGSAEFTLALSGSNFNAASTVKINGNDIATTFIDSDSITAVIPASYIVNGGTPSITVFTPLPGGGASTGVALTVTQVAINPTITQPTCYSDGGIVLTPSGGTSPYSYDWSDLAGTSNPKDRTGLLPTNYSVTVTDANGCATISGDYAITAPTNCTGITVCKSDTTSILSVPPDANDTSFTWTLPLGATINSGQGTSTISVNWTNVAVGGYPITVVGNNSCGTSSQSIMNVYVQQPIASASADLACSGSNLNLYASGGVSYSWSGPNGFTSQSANPVLYNATSVLNGTYSVIVTNSNGCSAITSTVISVNTSPSITGSTTNPTAGNANGSVTLSSVSGGSGFTYAWTAQNNPSFTANTQNISSLTSDNYTVLVTNASGCNTSQTFSLSDITLSVASSSNVSCYNGTNGTITLNTPSGGTAPYSFVWTASNGGIVPSGQANNQNLTNLIAGKYSVVVTDSNNAQGFANVTITQPSAIQADGIVTNINCNAGTTGAITLTVTGGTGSYTYSWADGPTTKDRSSLAAGTYTVIITDANSCTLTRSFTITQPTATITTIATVTGVSCYGGSTGQAILAVSGGTSPYTYSWNGTSFSATTKDISNRPAGTYNVTITDSKLCTLSLTAATAVVITQPAAALSLSNVATNVNCKGNTTGAINLTATGGTTPYTYSWSNGVTTEDLSNLAAGTYSVTVIDAKNCSTTDTVTITEPTANLSASNTTTNVSCNGGATGAIDLTVSGGTSAYTYLWSNGATNEDLSSKTAGVYSVIITDANGCTTTNSATLTQPAAISVSGLVTNVVCNGSSTGAIAITASGGTGTYTYNWGGGITTKNRSTLAAGTYTVTVTDASSCTSAATSFVVTQSPALALTTTKKNIGCKSASNGSIALSVTGGVYPYSYSWTGSNGFTASTQNIDNIPAGTYTITVTDANSCTASQTGITLTQPASVLSIVTTPSAVTCQGGSNGSITAVPSGGTSPYTYAWSTGATTNSVSGLPKGPYTVVVTDVNGCSLYQNVLVNEPATKIELYANVKESSSCGNATGAIEVSVVNGNGPFAYSWTNTTQTTANPTGLAAGNYSVSVLDNIGCSASLNVIVATATALTTSITTYPKTCLYNDGSAYAIVTGGVPPYTYSWNNGATSQNIGLLSSGTVSVSVTDANGCNITQTAAVGSISCLSPIAVNDTFNTNYQTALSGTVATGDSDPDAIDQDHPFLQYFSTQNPTPSQGVLNWGTDYNGAFTFVPAAGFAGVITLTYKVFDATGLSATGTYTITVGPSAINDALGTPLNTALTNTVNTNDFFATGSVFSKLSEPTHGTIVFNTDGSFVYTPNTNYAGDDSFTYKICLGAPNETICSNTATVLISINGSADVAISKTVNTTTPNVGSNVVFTLTATNNGPNLALGVNVTDSLPTGYTYVSNTSNAGSFNSTTGVWTVGSLANATTATLQITATVNPAGDYTNSATITSDSVDPGSSNNSDSVTTIPVLQSDISISGSVNNASQSIGSSVVFTITVTNNGPNNATGVNVADLLPSGFTFVSNTAGVGTYDAITGVWTIGDLSSGTTVTLTITAIVNSSSNHTNTAVVSSTTHDPNSVNNTTSQVVTPGAISNLSLTKTLNNANPYVGGLVEFTLTATNNGPSNASGVSVLDPLPSGYTYNSDNGTGSYNPTTGVWTIGNMTNGATATLKVYAIVKASGNYTNSATISSTDQPDNDTSNNSPSVTPTTVVAQADLSIIKSVNTFEAVIGNNVVFTLAVTNNGPSDATGVNVSDLLPSGYTYVSYTTASGTYSNSTGLWNVGAIANGSTATIAITASINSTGNYINVASVNATTADLSSGNNTSTKTVTPIPLLVINNPAAVCFPTTIDITASAITAGSSSNLTYSYWNDSNATSPYSTPTNATNGTYYIKATTTSGNYTVEPVFVIVTPVSVSGSISGAATVCSGTNSTTLTLSGYTGTIQWQSSNALAGTYANIDGAISATYTATNLTSTTYYKAVVTNGVCSSSTSSAVSIVVNSVVNGTISGAGTVCSAITNTTLLTLNGSVGSIQWQSSSNNTLFTNINGANASTYTAINLSANTYFRAIISSSSCTSATTISVEITVLASNIWNGSISTAWNTAANWSCGVPASGDNIEIPGGLTNYPILDGPRNPGNIILANGATINLNNTTLVVSGTFSGTGTLIGGGNSGLTINGSGNQGTFYMNQTTPGTSNVVENFTLNSSSTGSATLGNAMSISGILTLTNGTFNTGDNLTLTSNGTKTAVVAPITDCSAVTITGDVTVERFFPARRAFRFISSPVTTTTTIRDNWQEGVNNPPPAYVTNLNPHPGYGTHITGNMTGGGIYGFDVTQTTNNSMFTYNNASGAWGAVPNTNATTLTAGVPYRLLIRGDRSINMSTNAPTPTNTIIRAKGALKICDASAGTLNQNANGFSFIGNPYQATVDIKAVLTQSSNINSNFYWVWDPTINTRGGYVAYDLSLGLNPVSGSHINEFLQPWQGCFVKNTATGLGSITFHESFKSTSIVNENAYKSSSAAYIRATLYESNTLASNGVAADGLIVKFGTNYNNSVDGSDAAKLVNQDEIFAAKNNTSLLGIESRMLPLETDVIPLNITQYRFTNYTIVAEGTNMSGIPAYLHDQLLQTYTEIPQSSSISYPYIINASDATTSAADRFRIVFQNPNLNINTNSSLNFTMYPNPSKQGVFDIVMTDATDDTKLVIYNTIGQEVYTTNLTPSSINHIDPNKVFAVGVYYVKITKEQVTTIKKLIIE